MNGYLSSESKPAWYELSFKSASVLGIGIHRAAYEALTKIKWADAPGVTYFQKVFNLSEFVPPGQNERSWGFSESLQLSASERPEWIAFDCHLPRLREERTSALPLRSSLSLLMTALWLSKGDTGWKDRQLMVVEDIALPTDPAMHFGNGSLSVTLAPEVMTWISGWISAHGEYRHISEVIEAMKAASEYMWESSSGHGRFGAMCRKPKWLNLQVPGDACGLDPGDYYDQSLEAGYTLQPHNVDGPLQQLTFLAGLARLQDLIRADQR